MNRLSETVAEPLYGPANAYDLAAPYYDAWKWQAFWRHAEPPAIVSEIDEWATTFGKPRLVDIGCGTGWYLETLEPFCANRVGADISRAMLARARARLPDVDLLQADVRRLPFRDEGFDIVLCARVLSHVAEIAVALGEIARIARRGGLIILTNVDSRHDYGDTRLPIGAGHVQAQTFKHSRATVASLLAQRGLRHVRSWLISCDGERTPVADFARDSTPNIVGWITVWRR